MKLKLIKPYLMFTKGETIDVGAGVAELLIIRKIAEPVEDPKEAKKRSREKQ